MNNLSEIMQARLDKWRNNTTPVKSAEKVRGSFVARSDFGDDISDWEMKEREREREHFETEKRQYGK